MSIERVRERLALISRMRGRGLGMSPSFSEQDVTDLIAEIERLNDDTLAERYDQLKAENEALVAALNDILRVTPMGVEAFGIAALVLGELGVSKEASHD